MCVLYPDELDCDFAETYGVFAREALPVRKAAVLAAGLPDNSRVKRRLSGARTGLEAQLLALCADALHVLVWQNTKDGQRGRNKPQMIAERMLEAEQPEEELQSFSSGAAFMLAWNT